VIELQSRLREVVDDRAWGVYLDLNEATHVYLAVAIDREAARRRRAR
jgi:hypothetical protein